MTRPFARIRRFHFNLPQRIAAGLLALFLAQGLWLTTHQTLSDRDYQYARCGREVWERPSALAGYYTTCGNIHDGILVYRLAGLPLTLNFELERVLDHFRKPEDRVIQVGGEISPWELRHQITHVLLLLRLPFLLAGCVLGAGLWWVTRRLYGNLGGYTALALYCFSPPMLRACVTPSAEVLSALAVYGGVYTCIGVAHAMQGPRHKWRPRIVLLACAFGMAAGSHIAALPVVALMGLIAMLWVAEGRRAQVLPIVLVAGVGALVMLFACYGFSPDAFSYVFRSAAGFVSISIDPARRFFSSLPNVGVSIAAAAALLLYLAFRRSRYFGNTTPAALRIVVVAADPDRRTGQPLAVGNPFSAYLYRGCLRRTHTRAREGRLALAAGGAVVVLQVVLCGMSLAGWL